MHPNEQMIHDFYTSFQHKDYQGMQSCYAEEASFSDPIFGRLNALQVRSMWEMFCTRSEDLHIEYMDVRADDVGGKATWHALYTFSTTGNKVKNKIQAEFIFRNGKIIKHIDTFSFYKWARQALGWKGVLFGWTPVVQKKVRKMALKSLEHFMKSR